MTATSVLVRPQGLRLGARALTSPPFATPLPKKTTELEMKKVQNCGRSKSRTFSVIILLFFFKQDATYTDDKYTFCLHICAQEKRQLQMSIELETL